MSNAAETVPALSYEGKHGRVQLCAQKTDIVMNGAVAGLCLTSLLNQLVGEIQRRQHRDPIQGSAAGGP